jgi:Domain of unknown function (DUF4188)
MPTSARDGAYMAALWEHPALVIALFGIQILSEEGARLYAESGIPAEIDPSLEAAEGLLLNRPMMSQEGPILLQYWRSQEDLDRYARALPHGRWWKWLFQHAGEDLGFYHEIYEVKMAEAIYEPGTTPVGPALFSTAIPVSGGEGRARERKRRFLEAVEGKE